MCREDGIGFWDSHYDVDPRIPEPAEAVYHQSILYCLYNISVLLSSAIINHWLIPTL